MARQENVVGSGQIEAVKQRLVWGNGLGGLETLAIAAAEDVGGNHELVATHGRLARDFVGIDINQLDHPIGVRATGGGKQIGHRLPADFHWRAQDVGNEHRHIGATGGFALIIHEP